MRIDENKTELFRFLSQHSLSLTEGNSSMLYTYDSVCQSNETTVDGQFLSPCNHEFLSSYNHEEVINLSLKGLVLKFSRRLF